MAKKTLRAKCLEALQLMVRLKNADDNGYCKCVTCDAMAKWNEMDGGHYIPKGNSSKWALDERNIWPQCKGCNGFGMKYGTALHTYTLFMQDYFGEDFVRQMIETKKEPLKLYKADYEDMLSEFKEQIKLHKKRVGA